MTPTITFFPVGNGDMTLVQLSSGRCILIDINIRQPDEDGSIRDVLADLRARLPTDDEGRHYVHAMLLTHPDQDHCRGLKEHFHLDPLSAYKTPAEGEQGKIVIREMWSSAMVFRRRPKSEALCKDGEAWRDEAKRRANLFKEKGTADTGDRIQVMGEDEEDSKGKRKTDGLESVLVKAGQTITRICGIKDGTFSGYLVAPKGKGDAADEERRSTNHSSVIVRFAIAREDTPEAVRYLAGGDALVGIWERIWSDHKSEKHVLEYDVLGAPHHSSWRSLSYESWSDTDGKAAVCKDARKALGQALDGAFIVASSKPVADDKDDPPCIGAKREYEAILAPVGGIFINTATYKDRSGVQPLVFEVTEAGPELKAAGSKLGVLPAAARAGVSKATLDRIAAEANDRPPTTKPQTTRGFS